MAIFYKKTAKRRHGFNERRKARYRSSFGSRRAGRRAKRAGMMS